MSKDSLKDKAIVISGVFEKYSRNELKDIIHKAGGKASSSISKNTSLVLAGDKMGPSKKEKANELNIEIISEAEFINRFLDSSESLSSIIFSIPFFPITTGTPINRSLKPYSPSK